MLQHLACCMWHGVLGAGDVLQDMGTSGVLCMLEMVAGVKPPRSWHSFPVNRAGMDSPSPSSAVIFEQCMVIMG